MNDHEMQEVIGAIGMFALVILVVTITVWQLFARSRAKAAGKRETGYQQLAERAFEGQQRTESQLGELAERLTDLQNRTGSLERILKDVE